VKTKGAIAEETWLVGDIDQKIMLPKADKRRNWTPEPVLKKVSRWI
jgi:hypothetical protein